MKWERKITASGGKAAEFKKIGDEVEGLYVGVQFDANGKFGPTNKHLLKTTEGNVIVVYAKPNTTLDELFNGETGKYVKVVYTGSVPSNKGNPRKLYELFSAADVPRLDQGELPEFAANAADEEPEIADDDEELTVVPASVAKQSADRLAALKSQLSKSKKA